MDPSRMHDLCVRAAAGEKRAVARLVSLFEDTRDEAAGRRAAALAALDACGAVPRATFIGITGTPGAGKSTLVGVLAKLVSAGLRRVAVLAVDPASLVSGGALLGDRTRVSFPSNDPRLFFRSQSSALALGGLGRMTFHTCRVLERVFDVVFVETVGIGQSETEIRDVADRVYLVLQPLAGDHVQFMKAGIMEIPDAIVLHKCDEERAARRSLHALRASLAFARPDDEAQLPVFTTSAVTGRGIDALAADVIASLAARRPTGLAAAQNAFFTRWVEAEYGRKGLAALEGWAPPAKMDAAELAFHARFADVTCGRATAAER